MANDRLSKSQVDSLASAFVDDRTSLESLARTCLERCEVVARMTEREGEITRRFLTPPMRSVHQQLDTWAAEWGLDCRVDSLGNWLAKRPSSSPNAKTLLIGSHLDTVPNGGRFDGTLGVVMGLSVIEATRDLSLPFHLQVVGFSEEEGVRYALPYLGSRCLTGTFDSKWLDRFDDSNVSMRSAIESFGLSTRGIAEDHLPPDSVLAFVEPHIEQGPQLIQAQCSVGLVTAIAGQSRMALKFTGMPGHAGTTPMDQRSDALVAVARVVTELTRYAENVEDLRFTFGRIEAQPNARNVIAGVVHLTADVRHADDRIRLDAVEYLKDYAEQVSRQSSVRFEIVEHVQQAAIAMDPSVQEALGQAVLDSGLKSFELSSGAGHDAAVMAEAFPTGMLFLRQPSPISHHPDENVNEEDVADGIQVLINWVTRLAKEQ